MRLSERNSLYREVVRQLCSECETPGRLGHAFAVEARRPQHLGQDAEHREHRVDRVEEWFLILLEILRVAEREALEGDEQGVEISDEPSGLASHQLISVGVLLLRH